MSDERDPATAERPAGFTGLPAGGLRRDFTAGVPDRGRVAGIACVSVWLGFVCVVFGIGLFSRGIVGWRVSNGLRAGLVLDVLGQAIWSRRQQGITGLVHHGGHGVQYRATACTGRLAEAGIEASAGFVGDSFGNAAAGSVNRLCKKELIWHEGPWSGLEAVEPAAPGRVGRYSTRRLHGHRGDVPPAGHEDHYCAENQPVPAITDVAQLTLHGTRGDSERGTTLPTEPVAGTLDLGSPLRPASGCGRSNVGAAK